MKFWYNIQTCLGKILFQISSLSYIFKFKSFFGIGVPPFSILPTLLCLYSKLWLCYKVPSNKCNFPSFFAQFSSIFFPGGSPVSIKWPSSVLYGNFTFSFTYLSYTKHYKFRKTSDLKQQERKLSGKMLACCAGGQGSIPRSGRIVFFICLISQ